MVKGLEMLYQPMRVRWAIRIRGVRASSFFTRKVSWYSVGKGRYGRPRYSDVMPEEQGRDGSAIVRMTTACALITPSPYRFQHPPGSHIRVGRNAVVLLGGRP